MKLNELTKKELVELLNLIISCDVKTNYVTINNIISNYLLIRYNKNFDMLMLQSKEFRGIKYFLEWEKIYKKIDTMLDNDEYYFTLDELEECKRENNKI